MEMDSNNKCPIVDVDGFIEAGKQFDLDIILPEDERNVIFGVIRDNYCNTIPNAVVKLIEIVYEKGEEVRKPVSHTFTNDDGEFVFGPLCPNKKYALDIWVNRVKHVKLCTKGEHKGKCLKGIDINSCDNKPSYPPMEARADLDSSK